MIKSITMSIAGLLMFSSVGVAGSCPMKISAIDDALAKGTVKNVEMVKKLRDEGEAAHKAGQHGKSVSLLLQAMKAGGI